MKREKFVFMVTPVGKLHGGRAIYINDSEYVQLHREMENKSSLGEIIGNLKASTPIFVSSLKMIPNAASHSSKESHSIFSKSIPLAV
ncbi:hypothetical protein P3S67_002193 [Capsicum chacoense]